MADYEINSNRIVIIPVYNEENRLSEAAITKTFSALNCDFVLVNDGSTDSTPDICDYLSSAHSYIHVIHLTENSGKATALLNGLDFAVKAGYLYAGVLDADQSVTDEDLLRGLDILIRNKNLLLVSGARVGLAGLNIHRPPIRKWVGRVVATLVSGASRIAMYDPQSPCKWYRVNDSLRRAVAQPARSRWFGEQEILVRYLKYSNEDTQELPRVLEYSLNAWIDKPGGHLSLRSLPRVLVDFSRFIYSVSESSKTHIRSSKP